MKRVLFVFCTLFAHSAAAREPERVPVDSALQRTRGMSVGVFDPLRVALTPRLELVTHPLLFLALDPNARLRVGWIRTRHFALSGEYGLSLPTQTLRFTKGYLFPTWDKSDANVGWVLVPSAGVSASWLQGAGVLSAHLDTALGVQLGRNDATPLDTYAPLELVTAPVTSGFRHHLGVQYDLALWESLHVRVGIDTHLLGHAQRSPWVHDARIAVDVYPSSSWRLSFGAIVYDYDQRRTEVRTDDDGFAVRERVRSREIWPTFDLVYQR